MLFLLAVAVAASLVWLAKALLRAQQNLVPLKHKVLEKKQNLIGRQKSALGLVNQFVGDIIHYQGNELGLAQKYYATVEQQMYAGGSGSTGLSILHGIAPQSTQSMPLYLNKQAVITRLDMEFQSLLQEYNAAVTALNTQMDLPPASFFGGSFFGVTPAVYLMEGHDMLLPPDMVKMHLDAIRQLVKT